MTREEKVRLVMEALVEIWPRYMTAPTGSGLQWGQLIAERAVTTLEEDVPPTDDVALLQEAYSFTRALNRSMIRCDPDFPDRFDELHEKLGKRLYPLPEDSP